jgi:hypothetical protein
MVMAFSNWPSINALVICFSDSESASEKRWNGLSVLAPLVAAIVDKKSSPSLPSAKMVDSRLFFAAAAPLVSKVESSVFTSSDSEIPFVVSASSENPRYSATRFLGLSEISVSMTFQSAFSSSLFACAMCESQILLILPARRAFSKDSVAEPTPESTEKLEIRILDDLGCPAALGTKPKLTNFPPKPNEAPEGRSSHFGAFFKEKDAPCGCV